MWQTGGFGCILALMNARVTSRHRVLPGLGGLLLLFSLGAMDAAHFYHHCTLDPAHADHSGRPHALCAVLHAGALVADVDVVPASGDRVDEAVAPGAEPLVITRCLTPSAPRAPPAVLS
jgi:hypothetical protein